MLEEERNDWFWVKSKNGGLFFYVKAAGSFSDSRGER